jgi:putative Mn2+ efflux pump MntP
MTAFIAAAVPVVFLALSMSTDAFAAAIAKGARLDRPSLGQALRTGLIFGSIEAAMPLIGWAMGKAASRFIGDFDHWIAFGILTLIGAKMIWDALRREPDEEKPSSHSLAVLVVTAIGTMMGRSLGEKFGHWAEAAGGVVLIAIGVAILAEHTLM